MFLLCKKYFILPETAALKNSNQNDFQGLETLSELISLSLFRADYPLQSIQIKILLYYTRNKATKQKGLIVSQKCWTIRHGNFPEVTEVCRLQHSFTKKNTIDNQISWKILLQKHFLLWENATFFLLEWKSFFLALYF